MAPVGKAAKGEALWREAWVGCPHIGVVEVGKDAAGQEQLVIKCKSVFREHGAEAEVVDDGRTVGVGLGDTVAFGIVQRKGKGPIAVNIFRTQTTKKKKRRVVEAEEAEDEDDELPPDLVGELPGVVRNAQSKTGDYFIECPKVWDAYSRDPKIFKADMPDGIEIGDPIYFKVKPPSNELSAPIAKSIRKAPAAIGKEVMALARDRGKGKGFGKGGGKGGRPPIRRSGGATMRMNGIVKRPSETTGRYFIFCQDISDVYNKDAQIPDEEVPASGLNVGDRIAFDVDEPDENRPNETPWAFNIKVVGGTTGKKKALPDVGDAEEEGDGEIEEKEDAEADDAEDNEEPELGKEEDAEAEDLDAQLAALAEEEGGAPKPAKKRRKTAKAEEVEEQQVEEQEPTTTEGWVAAQDRLFPGLSKLPKGWIRIRSKSRGLVYFYNVDSGESTPHEPRK